MTFPGVLDPATRPCAQGPQPGTVALAEGVMRVYAGMGSLGIFNCRDVVTASGERPPPSVHGNGRAWDARPLSKAQGDLLARELVAHHLELGVQKVIWWRQVWSVLRPEWIPYGGVDPHTGHLHIEQNRAGAAGLTVGAVLVALAPEEDDVALSDEDVERIAAAVWKRVIRDDRVGMKAPAQMVMGDIFHHARAAAREDGPAS